MSDDLVKQAELRHQRRPRSTQHEELVLLDNHVHNTKALHVGGPESKQSLPPIRHHGNVDINTAILGLGAQKPEDRPRTPRRRVISQTNPEVLGGTNDFTNEKKCCLPYIKCRVNNKEIKALINTGSQMSVINRRVYELFNFSKPLNTATISIEENTFQLNLTLYDSGTHDLVLGMDFISYNNCILDFKSRTLKLNGSLTTNFLSEEEMPLKFRSRQGLAASM